MGGSIAEELGALLNEGVVTVTNTERPLEIRAVTVEYVARNGKLVPRLTVVLEPRD